MAIAAPLHVGEEFSPGYCEQAELVCRQLWEAGLRTVADVSIKTQADPRPLPLAKARIPHKYAVHPEPEDHIREAGLAAMPESSSCAGRTIRRISG